MKVPALEGISWLSYVVIGVSLVVLIIGITNYLIFRHKIKNGYQDADEFKELRESN